MMPTNKRIEVVDALRGFAILCILLLHCSNHFLYGTMPKESCSWLNDLNNSTQEVLYFLFEGKAFGIFALLFGFTFGIQYFKAQEKSLDFRLRFLWRMVLLAGFGIINAAFFAGGDPLVFMAIVAVVLPLVARLNSKIILLIASLLFLQPVELYKAILLWITPNYELVNYTDLFYNLLPQPLEYGAFFPMVWNNITFGLKACLAWAFEYGRVSQTPALYLIGFLLYKHHVFTNIHHTTWDKLTIGTLITTPVLYIVKFISNTNATESFKIATTMWYNLSAIFLIIALFVLLFRTSFFQKLIFLFRIYGKMSLTNFVLQSIIGTFLFYPYGLHLSRYCGIFSSVLIGIAIAILQIIFSFWWLKKHRQGPLEYLWHRATYIL
jgi:uncharacterized protein